MVMSRTPVQEITHLLLAGRGDQLALEKLIPLVYEELRRLAKRHMNRQRPGTRCRRRRSSTRPTCG